MSTDLIRYDLLVQEALKGVVRRVLTNAAREGLPGEHHFYISFRTDRPGVRLSPRLRERYPADMTIVLQHQFSGLAVNDQAFEVGLSFSGVPERLRVPFDALTGFFDPSVQFGLKFEPQEEAQPAGEAVQTTAPDVPPTPLPAPLPQVGRRKPGEEPPKAEEKPESPAAPAPGTPQEAAQETAQVVILDAFRKKN
ncbi:ClpXP protease specificity-enhancing factor SspB [Enterovirga sp.]|uniref:SspB family protein n=1 Tax=Enterovirga sp. TaxID=2026350 RepID=UPI002BE13ABC|nr:ClpXP protease specificity-enhancing factor SspB [Enterovirga sp.]HMO29460.1 ClpXP protease specificity-enhancing factor SspB [Enterovirga sp.]